MSTHRFVGSDDMSQHIAVAERCQQVGLRSAFRVDTFDPPHYGSWVGRLLTIRIHYHHRLQANEIDPD